MTASLIELSANLGIGQKDPSVTEPKTGYEMTPMYRSFTPFG